MVSELIEDGNCKGLRRIERLSSWLLGLLIGLVNDWTLIYALEQILRSTVDS